MSTTFTASSGVKIEPTPLGIVMHSTSGYKYPMYTSEVAALREFLQHERDEELGRWRSKLHPEWVGYYNGPNAGVLIDERCGAVHDIARSHVYDAIVTVLSTEYFAAHPEPKPWRDAKNGDLWQVKFDDDEEDDDSRCALVAELTGRGLRFVIANGLMAPAHYALDEPRIVMGRRIWPDSSDG